MEKSEFELLRNKLSKCQVISSDNEIYPILIEMKGGDWINLNNGLQSKGYHIIYNNVDNCFVVH